MEKNRHSGVEDAALRDKAYVVFILFFVNMCITAFIVPLIVAGKPRCWWHDFLPYLTMNFNSNEDLHSSPDNRSCSPVYAESVVDLNNEKIAMVFYEVVRNRLQHVNSWCTIAEPLHASFQLVNSGGIEVYRKAQVSDFLKVDIWDPDGEGEKMITWAKIDAMENESSDSGSHDGFESYGFRIQTANNPAIKQNSDALHGVMEPTTSFLVVRHHNRITASINDIGSTHGIVEKFEGRRSIDRKILTGAAIRFSMISWKKLTDGLISR